MGPPAPIGARVSVHLWPERLMVELEVANAADEEDPAAASLELGRCGLEGHCCSMDSTSEVPPAPAPGVEQALAQIGLRLESIGFESLTVPAAVAVGIVSFQAIPAHPVTLAPGQMLDGKVT